MTNQLYLAHRIVSGRAHTGQDLALQRTAELSVQDARRARRTARRARRAA